MKYIVTNEMNGIMEILDSKGVIAHANSIGGYDIDNLNSAIILLKREGYRVFESQDENRTLSGMDIEDFYEWMNSDNVIKNRDGSYSTQDSNFRNSIGSIDELKKYYKREFGGSYAKGGSISGFDERVSNKIQEIIDYLEERFGGKVTFSRLSGSMNTEGYVRFKKRGDGEFFPFATDGLERRKIHREVQEKTGFYTLGDNRRMDIKMFKGRYAKGGEVDANFEMVKSQAKELMHHAEELMQILKKKPHIEAWVVGKIERASTDLSDVTHYLDGMFAKGGRINYSEYYKMGGKVESCEKFDENGERKIDLKSIKELTECVNKLPQTKDFYFVNGEYTPERKRLHKQIIYNIKKDLVCVQNDKPIAILMGGSPASGKSTFLKKYRPYLLEEEILKVDADDIRSKLPEYEGYNATQTHLETKDIVNLLLSDRNIGIPCKFDLIYDGTMNSTKSYLPLIDLLKSLGYKIFVVYIDKVPKEVVIKRALERYKKSGRFVPLEVIEDFFDKGKSALNEVKNKVDGYMVIDGSNTDYNVIEKGGMQLPKTRLYSKIGEQIKVTPDKVIKDYKLGGNLHG
jgi:predicted ABC-type ATPase